MPRIRFGKRSIDLPANRVARIALGSALIAGGVAGFLPILGFWMVPLGLLVLSHDVPAVRRARRRLTVAATRWWSGRKGAKSRSA